MTDTTILDGWYWVSSIGMTGGVEVQNGLIIKSAPIFKKFVGQKFGKLTFWLQTIYGTVIYRRLNG